jgi:hypothetical protein
LLLKERQWENLANLPDGELKKILMDETLLKKYASEFGMSEDALRARLEELLQQRMGVKSPESPPEKSPIEPIRQPKTKSPETQFRPPETEGFVTTREGQVLIVRPKEDRVVVRPTNELPDVQTRLRILRRRLKIKEEEDVGGRTRDTAAPGDRDAANRSPGTTETERQTDRSSGTQADKASAETTDKQTTDTTQTTNSQTTTDASTTTTTSTVVVNERNAVQFIPYLPPSLLVAPVTVALPAMAQIISQIVGAPVSLRLPPPPSPNMPLGTYLRSMLRFPALGRQREVYVLI